MLLKIKERDNMKNWKVPGIILVLLIIAMTFRWQTVKTNFTGDTKTELVPDDNPFSDKLVPKVTAIENTMTKVVEDRWNGSVWDEEATVSRHTKTLIAAPWIPLADSDTLTIVWYSLAGLDLIWLIFTLSKKRNKEKKLLIREAGI
jgi:hypothetical protein